MNNGEWVPVNYLKWRKTHNDLFDIGFGIGCSKTSYFANIESFSTLINLKDKNKFNMTFMPNLKHLRLCIKSTEELPELQELRNCGSSSAELM